MKTALACMAALGLLAACSDEPERPNYGEISPPWVYAPSPAPVYTPRPGYVAPPGGAPYAVPGQRNDAYIGPDEAKPNPGPKCRPVADSMFCD